ncbi:MAG: hypothetical protein ACON5H_08495 [Akkermansiaceae bacterium]
MKHTFFLLAALAATVLASKADPIGINFGAGRDDASMAATDEAGFLPQTNWNNAAGASGGALALNDASGNDSGATVTWATDEEWSIGTGPADGNGRLLNGWVSANNNNAPDATITIENIPFASYTLYVYFNHDRGTEDVDLSEANGAFPAFRAHENDTDILAPVTLVEQLLTADGDDTQQGNFASFSNLSAANLEIVMAPAGPAGSTDRGAITGIQIVELVAGDADGDGLDDSWEQRFGLDFNDNGLNPNNNGVPGNPDNGAAGDPDMDGVPNSDEEDLGTDPTNDDTDMDNLKDGVETGTGIFVDANDTGTNPLLADSDEDNLRDDVETNTGTFVDDSNTGTNPNKADTDDDTLRDDWEIANMLDPFDNGTNDPDNGGTGNPDNDGLDNTAEQAAGTNPRDEDTDDDNLTDEVETNDGDFISITATGTDPLNPDSDADGLLDGVEDNTGTVVNETQTGTNPNNADTDGDFVKDGWEIANGRNPVNGNDNGNVSGALGLNFGAGRADAALLATDTAGLAAQANWNNLEFGAGGPVNLLDDTGSSSGATVTWGMDEEWSFVGPAADTNGTLLTGWVSANTAGGLNTIDISNIPYGTYDLVVYTAHDRGTEDVDLSEANNAFELFRLHEDNTDILNPVVLNQQSESAVDNSQTGNFIVIPNLTATTLNLVLDPAGDVGSADRGAISGIQIVNRGGAGGPVILSIEENRAAGEVTITWSSINGRNYALDANSTLEFSPANEIDDSLATGSVTSFTETGIDFSANPKRFYRVREIQD